MTKVAMLLGGLLLASGASARGDDDPEPPKPGPIGVRLVAKQSKYVLDFKGEKKEDYVRQAKEGKIAPPSVRLELVITNQTKGQIRIRSSGSTNRLTLTVKGDGAVEGKSSEVLVRPPIQYTVLKPGEKLTIPIDRLADLATSAKKGVAANSGYHYWTQPGKYTVGASFYSLITMDYGGNAKAGYQTLTSRPVTLEVEK